MDVETFAPKELPGASAGWIVATGRARDRRARAVHARGEWRIDAGREVRGPRRARPALGQIHVFQVDERVAPDGDPDRNLGDLKANLLDLVPVVPHLMDVTAQ